MLKERANPEVIDLDVELETSEESSPISASPITPAAKRIRYAARLSGQNPSDALFCLTTGETAAWMLIVLWPNTRPTVLILSPFEQLISSAWMTEST